jgi:hypothetical protein
MTKQEFLQLLSDNGIKEINITSSSDGMVGYVDFRGDNFKIELDSDEDIILP